MPPTVLVNCAHLIAEAHVQGSQLLLASYLSPSVSAWSWCRTLTVSLAVYCSIRSSAPSCKFVTLSLHQNVPIHLHAHDFHSDTSHSESLVLDYVVELSDLQEASGNLFFVENSIAATGRAQAHARQSCGRFQASSATRASLGRFPS